MKLPFLIIEAATLLGLILSFFNPIYLIVLITGMISLTIMVIAYHAINLPNSNITWTSAVQVLNPFGKYPVETLQTMKDKVE